jgi:hypothetical protein
MANDAPAAGVQQAQILWNVPTGPPPLVNQFVLMPVPDADEGPAEIVVHLGYASAPPGDRRPDPNLVIPVTTVASFALTRKRAEQLKGFLEEQIAQWDRLALDRRGGPHEG